MDLEEQNFSRQMRARARKYPATITQPPFKSILAISSICSRFEFQILVAYDDENFGQCWLNYLLPVFNGAQLRSLPIPGPGFFFFLAAFKDIGNRRKRPFPTTTSCNSLLPHFCSFLPKFCPKYYCSLQICGKIFCLERTKSCRCQC